MATVAREVKKLWRRHTWEEYLVSYDLVVAKDGTTGQPISMRRQATQYRRLRDGQGNPMGPSLRAWACRSRDSSVRAWAERKGVQ